ncbi:MAG: cation diffusion facilitator family transporter [Gemmatimonadetes bacterium]|nr:cation diffusion facilitator family transporter [Gemmatimonadota bacterium]
MRNGLVVLVADRAALAEVANMRAAEHLEIVTRDADELAALVRHAGAIFIGDSTPEPVGDYIAGPSHVLPTGGTARYASPLGVYDFVKRTSLIRYSRAQLLADAPHVMALAEAEGLYGHAEAVRRRGGRMTSRKLATVLALTAGFLLVEIIGGVISNSLALRVLHGHHHHDLNVRGAYLHIMGDVLGSVGAIVAALVIHFFGWLPADAIISVLVSVLIFRSAWRLVSESGTILLDRVPEHMQVSQVEERLLAVAVSPGARRPRLDRHHGVGGDERPCGGDRPRGPPGGAQADGGGDGRSGYRARHDPARDGGGLWRRGVRSRAPRRISPPGGYGASSLIALRPPPSSGIMAP